MKIRIRELGLAAYVALKLGEEPDSVKRESGEFIFVSEKTKRDWLREYLESECYEHDENVMRMRAKTKT